MPKKRFNYNQFMGNMFKIRVNVLNFWRKYPVPVTTIAKEVGITNVTARAFLIDEKKIDFVTLCAFDDWLTEKKKLALYHNDVRMKVMPGLKRKASLGKAD